MSELTEQTPSLTNIHQHPTSYLTLAMAPSQPIPIAVIGMGCRFPGGANSPEDLWSMLAEGRNAWTEMPANRFNHSAFYHPYPEIGGDFTNHKGGHYLSQDIEEFDASFFGVSRLEAEAFDPQQRLVLEASWEAVENAGIPMNKFRGSNTSVYGTYNPSWPLEVSQSSCAYMLMGSRCVRP